jgi:hypothetical protein
MPHLRAMPSDRFWLNLSLIWVAVLISAILFLLIM